MSITLYRRALEQLEKNQGGVMATVVDSSSPSFKGAKFWWDEETMQQGEHAAFPVDVGEQIKLMCRQVWGDKKPQLRRIEAEGEGFVEVFFQPYLPPNFLVILGGGHISTALAPLAHNLNFQVTVVDDRPEFANAERFPNCRVICREFSEVFNELSLNLNTYVLIVTRGHKHDLLCLRKALVTPARYIGMIGSKRKVNLLKEQVIQEGFSEVDWQQRVFAPVGLPIGGQTPAEIAISILAEIIAVKHGKREAMEVKEN